MKTLLSRAIFGACLGAMSASTAIADEVILTHDKAFYSTFLQAVGDVCGFKEQAYTPPEQFKAFVQSSIASGQTPEMFTWWSGATFRDEMVATGQIAQLDDLWAELIANGSFTAASADPFTVDGHKYALPLAFNKWVMFYNPTLFAKAGITGEPKTWDEMMADADTLKAAGITPFVATNQDGWRGFIWFEEIMIRLSPEKYLGLFDGTTSYSDPVVHQAFQMWSDMYAKGYFSDPRSNQEVVDFASGGGAMNLMGDWAVGLLTQAGMEVGKTLDAFVVPNVSADTPAGMIYEASPLMISVEAAKNPAVMDAMRCWASDEGATVWANTSGLFMGNLNAPAPNAIVPKINKFSVDNNAALYSRWWEGVPADLQGDSVAAFASFMLNPTMEQADKVIAQVTGLHDAYWAEHK